jgi:predicted dehydrogenase
MTADSHNVRLASVGLGWWGKVLAGGARAAGAEIAGAYARSEESRDQFVAEYGGRSFGSYDELLSSDEVDGVLLATPHSTHAELIRDAADAGKHVFVEKPLTLTVESAKSAVAAADEAGVVLQVGHDRRRQPANRKIKQMIEEGQLGTVIMVESQQSTPNALGFDPDYWRANHDESPLGGMTSMGVHMVDTMTYLLGPIVRVSAFSKEILDHPAIDHATTIILEFESGPLGYLGTSFVVPRTTTILLRGTNGAVTNTENGERFLWQGKDDVAPAEQPIEILDTVADEVDEFIRCIRGEGTPETGGAEGTEVIAVLEAAVESVRSGRPAEVRDFR